MDNATYSYNDVKNDAALIVKLQYAKTQAKFATVAVDKDVEFQVSPEEAEQLLQRDIDEADIRIKTWRIR